MKTLFSLLLLAVFATASSAQTWIGESDTPDRLINRLDKQVDQRWKNEVKEYMKSFPIANNVDSRVLLDKERNLQTPASLDAAFSIHFGSMDTVFMSGTLCNMSAHLYNHTDSILHIVFKRQQVVPQGWSSSVCFGDLCYSAAVDSLPWGSSQYYEFPPFTETSFKLVLYAPIGADDSMAAYIRIEATNTKPDDTVSFVFRAKTEPQSSVGTSNVRSSFKIESIYPSPLVSGSSLKVKLTAPESAGYSYTIFDNLGREVAFGSTRQQLMIGENTVEISSLDGLLTGSYLLRVKFNGGGSDAIPFQVIR